MLLAFFFMSVTAYAQKQTYSGVVLDSKNEPVIGASVVQKGTSVGTVTDYDGNFKLSVAPGTTLVISYVGCKPQEVTVKDNMRIVLADDSQVLSDLVVIGYGVQKKSVVTASIAKVSADDLAGKAPVRVDNALKGLAAGVTVTQGSGAPGAGSQIRVRGIGTINDSNPLYIIDGMPCESGIENLNPNDIESIEVLKDAASGAIYGARAANGVILVTTKSGKLGSVKVNYNASFGWQTKWRKRDVLNARDYAVMMNEGLVNGGQAPKYENPYALGNGTDWQDAIFNDNAPVTNHEVSVSGASEKVSYYLSLGYYDQEGIVGGNYGKSNYNRLTMRSNTKYTLFDVTKEREWLNKLDITANLSYTRSKTAGIDPNTRSNGILNSALTLAPTLPVTYSGDEIAPVLEQYQKLANYEPQYDANGNLFMVPGSDYDNQINPVAYLNTACLNPEQWVHNYTANFAADLSIGWGVKYRLSYGADVVYRGVDRGYTTPYYLTASFNWGVKTVQIHGHSAEPYGRLRTSSHGLARSVSMTSASCSVSRPRSLRASACRPARTISLTRTTRGLTTPPVAVRVRLVLAPVRGRRQRWLLSSPVCPTTTTSATCFRLRCAVTVRAASERTTTTPPSPRSLSDGTSPTNRSCSLSRRS